MRSYTDIEVRKLLYMADVTDSDVLCKFYDFYIGVFINLEDQLTVEQDVIERYKT